MRNTSDSVTLRNGYILERIKNITTEITCIQHMDTEHRFRRKAIITKDMIHTKTLLEYFG